MFSWLTCVICAVTFNTINLCFMTIFGGVPHLARKCALFAMLYLLHFMCFICHALSAPIYMLYLLWSIFFALPALLYLLCFICVGLIFLSFLTNILINRQLNISLFDLIKMGKVDLQCLQLFLTPWNSRVNPREYPVLF